MAKKMIDRRHSFNNVICVGLGEHAHRDANTLFSSS